MVTDALIAWQFNPVLDIAATALTSLAAYVAFDLVRRYSAGPGRDGWLWLAGAALSFGIGLWSGHFIMLASYPLPFPIGYGGGLTAAGWALGVLASAGALAIGFGREPRLPQMALGAFLLALGATSGTFLYLVDLGISPALHWRPLWPGVALVLLTGALAACGWILAGERRASTPFRLGAALLAGVAVSGAHRLTNLGAGVFEGSASVNQLGSFGDTTLSVLASLGSLSVLATLLLLSTMESRMRAALLAAIERFEIAARTDALTRLPNRHHFDQRFETASQRNQDGGAMALLFIGLDNFKPVNDSFGRRVGDLLLQRIAERLRNAVGNQGMLARVGGDEFVLLLDRRGEIETATAMAKALLTTIAEPCEIDGRAASITASIGVAPCRRGASLAEAMAHAEAATGYVKRDGGATFALFEPRMLGNAREQVELLRDLRMAIVRDQLELFFQPKVYAPTGEITGAEALLRWNHPQRGMVSPTVFVPIAERHGLIGALGEWVIDEACRHARQWRDGGLRMRVAINLSVHQLRRPDLADRIHAALRHHQINPNLLTCEITESVAMEDSDTTMKMFGKLAAIGVHISIDDFGTGYSSLAYLRKLPVSELKIDRSFVLDLETSPDACAVVEAVVKLAHTLGLKVVAEGVETEGQNRILRGFGCDQLQGYLFAKPMTAKALSVWAMNDTAGRAGDFRDSLFGDTASLALS